MRARASLRAQVDESHCFMRAIGIDTTSPTFAQTKFYVAHECLLLPYEQALMREDSTTGQWCAPRTPKWPRRRAPRRAPWMYGG